jgi:hypothetical protein
MNRGKREKMSMWVAVGEQREEREGSKCGWEWENRGKREWSCKCGWE